MPTTSIYTTEEADLVRDRELIIDLWSRNLLAHTPEEHQTRFDWHYGENPTKTSCCFLIRHNPSGKVVGTAGLGIRHIYTGSRENIAGIAIDFTVEPQHRTLQPAIFLARAVASTLESGVDFIYALPNKDAKGIFQRIGYVEFGPFRRFVKVLDAAAFLRRRPLPGVVRGLLAFFINLTQRILDGLRGGFRLACHAVDIDWDDPRLESLWQAALPPDGMMGDRRIGYLQWRFERCPLHRHQLVGLVQDGISNLLGYAVVYEGKGGQLKVPDLLFAPDASMNKGLLALSHWANGKGFSSIAFEAVKPDDSLLLALRQAGFLECANSDVLFILDKRSASPAQNKPWYVLRGDEFYNTF